jgi:RNA polymerase sigma factor
MDILADRNELPAVFSEKITAAKSDKRSLNQLISEYTPFIKKCISGVFIKGQARRDYLTEAMLGFIQSVKTYREEKGAFIPYAQTVISNRLINAAKKEAATQKPLFSIATASQKDEKIIHWEFESAERQYNDLAAQKETQAEIAELNNTFAQWGFTWPDLLKNCPKQNRSRKHCHKAVRALLADRQLLEKMVRTGKLPVKRLSTLTGQSEKSLEKYRRYISALVLIMEGDYPYIHSFLPQFFDKEETL